MKYLSFFFVCFRFVFGVAYAFSFTTIVSIFFPWFLHCNLYVWHILYHVTLKRRAANPHAVLKYMTVIHLTPGGVLGHLCALTCWRRWGRGAKVARTKPRSDLWTSGSTLLRWAPQWCNCWQPQTRLNEAWEKFWVVARATIQENTTHSCGQPLFFIPEYGYLATVNWHKKIQLIPMGNHSFSSVNMVT